MNTLLSILLLTIIGTPTWLTNFEAAKTNAATEHKYILLNFSGSDWCAPCIKMKKEVFESEAFLILSEQRLILVRADFPRAKKNQLSKEQTEHNEQLAAVYNPTGNFPLTLLLNAKGEVIKKWEGYAFGSQDKFLTQLHQELSTK